jgi:hypothetical protein
VHFCLTSPHASGPEQLNALTEDLWVIISLKMTNPTELTHYWETQTSGPQPMTANSTKILCSRCSAIWLLGIIHNKWSWHQHQDPCPTTGVVQVCLEGQGLNMKVIVDTAHFTRSVGVFDFLGLSSWVLSAFWNAWSFEDNRDHWEFNQNGMSGCAEGSQ